MQLYSMHMFPVPLLFDENRPTEAELQIQNKGTRCQGVSDSRVLGRGIYCLVTTNASIAW
jgi:hypothetical protein